MFVKKAWKIVNGKKHVYYAIAKSYRPKKGGTPRHKIIANLSHLPMEIIDKIRILLKSPKAAIIEDLDNFFKKSFIYGPIVFYYLLMKQMGILKAMKRVPIKSKILMIAVILNRILAPRSKLGSVSWIKKSAFGHVFGIEDKKLEVNQIYKSMDVFHDRMKEIMDNFFKENQNGTQFLLYDITSVYFEGNGPVGLSKRGYSRDKRSDRPQILLALCLNEKRLPVYFDILAGNIQDKKTVIPFIEKIKKKYKVTDCIFVGDRGMVTVENLEKLREEDMDYIVALKHKDARDFLWEKEIKDKELFDKEVPVTILKEEEKKYVLCGSEFRKEHDRKLLNILLQKEKQALEHVKKMVLTGYLKKDDIIIKRAQKKLTKANRGKNFYDFEYKDGEFKIKEDAEYIAMAKNLCGYYILETTKTEMEDEKVEEKYKELKFVERSFKELKDIVDIRPIFHYADRRVKTHVFLCILAQVLVNKSIEVLKDGDWLRKDKESSFKKFLDELSEIRLGVFEIENAKEKIINQLEENHKEILGLFDMELKYFKNPFQRVVV